MQTPLLAVPCYLVTKVHCFHLHTWTLGADCDEEGLLPLAVAWPADCLALIMPNHKICNRARKRQFEI